MRALPPSNLYIGLMSGTSADAVDAVLAEITASGVRVMDHLSIPHPSALRDEIFSLCHSGHNEIDRLGVLDQRVAQAFAAAALQLLEQASVQPEHITAIGSHGQTIRHRPNFSQPFTLQIGDPNTIAEMTGICVVADFRRRDMAAGGQGAPLVPAFHRAAFQSQQQRRIIANIGGMANITDLTQADPIQGFDTGPGNCLLDSWASTHIHQPYDHNGRWAAQGEVDTRLLGKLMQHPFFHRTPPKSTGREEFDGHWLEAMLQGETVRPVDVQATLLELTCQSLLHNINAFTKGFDRLFICGGGACNPILMERLQTLTQGRVETTEALGVPPLLVESAAFAWLAHQTLNRLPGNLPSCTGAKHGAILGGIYPA